MCRPILLDLADTKFGNMAGEPGLEQVSVVSNKLLYFDASENAGEVTVDLRATSIPGVSRRMAVGSVPLGQDGQTLQSLRSIFPKTSGRPVRRVVSFKDGSKQKGGNGLDRRFALGYDHCCNWSSRSCFEPWTVAAQSDLGREKARSTCRRIWSRVCTQQVAARAHLAGRLQRGYDKLGQHPRDRKPGKCGWASHPFGWRCKPVRVRFNYQDGSSGGDGLDDPNASMWSTIRMYR